MSYLYDIIDHNPMDKVQRPKARKDELGDDETDAFTVDEVRYILACLEKEPLKWQAYVRLLIDTGIRRGETCGLQWCYVDFEESRITIAANLCYTASAGVYLDTPKTRKPRTIDVDPEVMNLLKTLQQNQAGTITSDFVFTKEGSSDPMHPQTPSEYFESFAKRYGMDGKTGEIVRVHHHLVVNAEAAPVCTEQWNAGGTLPRTLYGTLGGDLSPLAEYLIEQTPTFLGGKKRYHPSRNLLLPEPYDQHEVEPDGTIAIPPGYNIIWQSNSPPGHPQVVRCMAAE